MRHKLRLKSTNPDQCQGMVPSDRLEEGKVGFSRQAHLLFKDRLAWSFDAQGFALLR